MIRARYRNGLDKNELLQPGQTEKYFLQLCPTANCFLFGHRIRLEISSSDFPSFDRNHNTGGDDLREITLQSATQTILHGGDYAACISLPVSDGL